MPRKAALIAEESAESVSESPLRRSTRTRVISSPAPQTAIVGRARRNSTSSVDSNASVTSAASAASLPASKKVGGRTRRPSLTLESNLEKIGEGMEPGEIVTPVKRTRRGSISSLQDEPSDSNTRAGSPAVGAVADRLRSLRSGSRSPTSEARITSATTNGKPSKIRGRRTSGGEKVLPKRRASVALEPLDEEAETVDSPKKKAALKSLAEDVEVIDDKKKIRLSSDSSWIQDESAKDKKIEDGKGVAESTESKKKIRLSSDSSWIADDDKLKKTSDELKNPEIEEEPIKTVSNEAKETKSRRSSERKSAPIEPSHIPSLKQMVGQFMSSPKVVISPMTKILPSNKLTELALYISDDEDIKAVENTITQSPSSVTALKNPPEEDKMSPKRVAQSPVRRSPRLHSESVSDGSDSPGRKLEIVNLVTSSSSSPIIGGRISRTSSDKSISKELEMVSAATKETEENKKETSFDVDGSSGSFNLSSAGTKETEEKKKATSFDVDGSSGSFNLSSAATKETEENKKATSFDDSKEVVGGSGGSFNLSSAATKETEENKKTTSFDVDGSSGSLNLSSAATKETEENKKATSFDVDGSSGSLNMSSAVTKETEENIKATSFDDSKEVIDGSDGSFNLSLKTSIIMSSQEEGLDKSAIVESKTSKDDKLNISNESDKENAESMKTVASPNKRVSNVFKSKNVDESFFEAMDVEYPTDNDESLSVTNKKRLSLNKSASKLADNQLISDESTSGSLHLVCSDDSNDKKSEASDTRKSMAFIELDVDAPTVIATSTKPDDSNESVKKYLIDSRISIAPGNVLIPLPINTENEINNDSSTSDSLSEFENITVIPKIALQSMTIKSSQSIDSSSDNDEAIPKIRSISIRSSNSSKIKQHITISSSGSSSAGSDVETKLDKLISNKIVEFNDDTTDSSDSEFEVEHFLDDEAQEVSDEDTPSDDSNEIIDVGDNIESTDDERLEDEEIASASDDDFIDDDATELLNGNEDDNDLDYDGKELVKKRRRGRILTRPVDESDEEVDAPKTPDEVVQVETPKPKEKTVEVANEVQIPKKQRRASKRKSSSISVSENIKKDEIDNVAIAGKITNIVELFTASLNDSKGGNVQLNVSIDYDESSSDDEVKKVPRKLSSIELPASEACDSSTGDSKVSKIKILQDVRISGDLEETELTAGPPAVKIPRKTKKLHNKSMDDDVLQTAEPSRPKMSKKSKKQHDVSLDDDVFLPMEQTAEPSRPKMSKKSKKQHDVSMDDDVFLPMEQTAESSRPKMSKKSKKQHDVSMDDDVFLPNLTSHDKSVKIPTPKPSSIRELPDEIIKQLAATTKSKKAKKQGNFEVQKEFDKSQPSKSKLSDSWIVSEVTQSVKPSKHNLIKETVNLIDKKDFKGQMIAKNKIKPKRPKKSFKLDLKTKKNF